MKTEDLIVRLARSAGPVQPLPPPSARLLRWALATTAFMVLAVIAIGPRADVVSSLSRATFMLLATFTIGTALLAAAIAIVLSVPGAERSRWQRALPFIAGGAWTLTLAYLLAAEGAAIQRLLQWPVHVTCLIEIAGLSLVPGWVLFRMLRDAAPLQREWAAALATLAATGFAAAATQFLCPIDDEAHQLIGHVLPVAVLSILGALAGRRYLNWLRATM